MAVKLAVRLANLPKEGSNFVTFKCGSDRARKMTYPRFYMSEFTRVENTYVGEEDEIYVISVSLGFEKDAEGKDTKRERLFLNGVKDEGFVREVIEEDNTELGIGELNDAIVLEVTKFEREQDNPEANRRMKWSAETQMPSTFYRIKVRPPRAQNHTYIGQFSKECSVEKGDTVDFDVRLFSKRAYDEDGNIDMSDKHVGKDSEGNIQHNGYPALEVVKVYKRED